jgi:pimeloyl-ACP methyl ester carboxylesterase
MKTTTLILALVFASYTGRAQNYFTTSDGVKMYYESYGKGNTALVFIHGHTLNTESWKDQTAYFKDKYRVIVVDLPGFGKSGLNRTDWSMDRYGLDVDELCNDLQVKNAILIGWSMGGPVALEAAETMGNKVKGIVLVDILQKLTFQPMDSAWIVDYKKNFDKIYNNYDFWLRYHNGDSLLAKRYVSTMPDSFRECWKNSLSSVFSWMYNDAKETVTIIKAPVRAINADYMKTDVAEWKQYHQDFDVSYMEKSTHFLVWQYPEKFNVILEKTIAGL